MLAGLVKTSATSRTTCDSQCSMLITISSFSAIRHLVEVLLFVGRGHISAHCVTKATRTKGTWPLTSTPGVPPPGLQRLTLGISEPGQGLLARKFRRQRGLTLVNRLNSRKISDGRVGCGKRARMIRNESAALCPMCCRMSMQNRGARRVTVTGAWPPARDEYSGSRVVHPLDARQWSCQQTCWTQDSIKI